MGGTAQHFDMATTAQLGPNQDHEWSHGKKGTGTGYNEGAMPAQLAQARADYAARAAGGTGSTPGQPAGFSGFTNAPAGSPAPAPASGGAYPPAPSGSGDAGPVAGNTTGTVTSAATTRPAGTGPASGPWGDDKLEPVKGPKAPEPLSPGQQLLSFGAKAALGLHPYGQAIVALDLLAEGFTGQGFIDALIARSDNPRTGGGSGSGGYRSLTGETASASGRDRAGTPTTPTTPTPKPPETKPIATVNNVVEKYIEDTTKRPTPAQRWNYEDDTYSEYA
jgi:hypothetical protein